MARAAAQSSGFDWNTMPPVLKVIGIAITIAVTAVTAAGAYYAIVARIDRLDNAMQHQGKTLESLALSVKVLAERAATAEEVDAKIERACFQMALANQGRWHCPFAGTPTERVVVRPVKTSTEKKRD